MGSSLLVAVVLAGMVAAELGERTPSPEHPLVRIATAGCPLNPRPSEGQREVVRELFRIEADEGVPEAARGILAAAACRESAYRVKPRCGDRGASCGLLQLHGSHKRGLRRMGAQGRDPRMDWRVVARYWLRRHQRAARLVERDCPGLGGYTTRVERVWASSNKTVGWRPLRRGGRIVARCARPGRESSHWRLLRAWRRRLIGD